MAALIAFYSRAGENYFGGTYRHISVGNTEKAAQMLAEITGGELCKIAQAEPYSEDYQSPAFPATFWKGHCRKDSRS